MSLAKYESVCIPIPFRMLVILWTWYAFAFIQVFSASQHLLNIFILILHISYKFILEVCFYFYFHLFIVFVFITSSNKKRESNKSEFRKIIGQARSCKTLQVIIRNLDLTLNEIGSHWRILNKGISWWDLRFSTVTLAALLRLCWHGAKEEAWTLVRRLLQWSMQK